MTTAAHPKPVTLAQLQKTRTLVAMGPSGNHYRIRPLNLARHALAGGLPAQLRDLALRGAEGVNEIFGDQGVLTEHGEEIRGYLDGLVRQVIVEPALPDDQLDLIPPVDYQWAVNIAMGEEDRDGEHRRLWGREPLSVWGTFRDEHGCDADCESCARARRPVADLQRGFADKLAGD